MGNDAPETKRVQVNDSLNPAVDLAKSVNLATLLMQTVAQSQVVTTGDATGNVQQPVDSSANDN